MATALEHYENLLAEHYTWLYGGWETKLEENRAFFAQIDLLDGAGKSAVDLGCGSGFQSVPLAQAGYEVYAVDISSTLLSELRQRADGLPIVCVEGDLLDFMHTCPASPDLVVCMTDTILHLADKAAIEQLFGSVAGALAQGGAFVLSFRDNNAEPRDIDRIIPVRSDDRTIFTCILEYEAEHVKVFDVTYTREGERWSMSKSFYRKVRVSTEWVRQALEQSGLRVVDANVVRGMTYLVAQKS
ncbi:MAG: class I SAM-dependent methyltransferase [Candidatus Hydrogenedentes bacterium]|nr:class I SAM-dependent methyltransferase [Candidatus Hydrogenedentota bacterium]